MRLTEATTKTLRTLIDIQFPEDIYFDICSAGIVDTQCYTQDEVRRARAAFGGGVVWNKEWVADCGWWEYTAKVPQGFTVNIYACRESPPTCKAIEETYEEEEKVPVAFETKMVTKKRIRWDCSGGQEVQA